MSEDTSRSVLKELVDLRLATSQDEFEVMKEPLRQKLLDVVPNKQKESWDTAFEEVSSRVGFFASKMDAFEKMEGACYGVSYIRPYADILKSQIDSQGSVRLNIKKFDSFLDPSVPFNEDFLNIKLKSLSKADMKSLVSFMLHDLPKDAINIKGRTPGEYGLKQTNIRWKTLGKIQRVLGYALEKKGVQFIEEIESFCSKTPGYDSATKTVFERVKSGQIVPLEQELNRYTNHGQFVNGPSALNEMINKIK